MATNTTTNPAPESKTQTDFMTAIQDKLLGQSEVVSSTNSQLTERLNSAISGIQTSADKSNQALESSFGRDSGYIKEKGGEALTAGRAAGSGGIMNMAALRELTQTTDRSLKDLEQRKQELILQNDSAAAGRISELQFKALEFQQVANQQTFSNLMGIANFGMNQEASKMAKENQTFQQKQVMANIALQYGIDIKAGETMEQLTSRAMVFASKEQKLQLAKLQAEVNLANAQTAKALKGDTSGVTDISLPSLVNQSVLFDSAGKNPVTDAEYGNLIGTITKAGKLDDYYELKQKVAVAQIQAEKKALAEAPKAPVKQKMSLMDSIANFGASLMGEKPIRRY